MIVSSGAKVAAPDPHGPSVAGSFPSVDRHCIAPTFSTGPTPPGDVSASPRHCMFGSEALQGPR